MFDRDLHRFYINLKSFRQPANNIILVKMARKDEITKKQTSSDCQK